MILFKHNHIFPILTGLKTQTRRTWKSQRVKIGSIQQAKTEMISRYYFTKIKIIAVRQEKLGNISPQDAHREGGYTLESYKAEFKRIYGFWDDSLQVYVVDFETV